MLVHLFIQVFGIKESSTALKVGKRQTGRFMHGITLYRRLKAQQPPLKCHLRMIFTKEINKVTQFLTSESHIATQLLSLE